MSPIKHDVRYGYIPESMYSVSRWCVWQRQSDGRKLPFRVLDGHNWSLTKRAKSDDADTWVSFKSAIECFFMSEGHLSGLSFALGDGWCGFDFDDVIVNGTVDKQAASWLARLGGYQEVSQSDKGIKSILRGTLSKDFLGSAETGRQFKGIPTDGMATEVYHDRRFFFLTGTGVDVGCSDADAVDTICAELLALSPRKTPLKSKPAPAPKLSLDDEKVIGKIKGSQNASKFESLWSGDASAYPSASEADLALASILMFWCGNNPQQTERLFSGSELGRREKWQGRQDYRERTIRSAEQSEVYRPRRYEVA